MKSPRGKSRVRRRPVVRVLVLLAVAVTYLLGSGGGRAGAAFGIASFDGEATANEAGAPATQAGSHPFETRVEMNFNYHEEEGACPPTNICKVPDGQVKDVQMELPPGLIGNPNAVPSCPLVTLLSFRCPTNTIIGTAEVRGNSFLYLPYQTTVFNLTSGPDELARFGYLFLNSPIILQTSLRSGEDHGTTISIHNSSQVLPVIGNAITLWGVPGDASHDAERGGAFEGVVRPFLTMPADCSGPLTTLLRVNSWQQPDDFQEASFSSHDDEGNPIGVEGCSQVPFDASLETMLEPDHASTTAAFSVDLRVSQSEDPGGLATAPLKEAVVRLPRGFSINTATAAGLSACTEDEVSLDKTEPAHCPASSKIGGVTVTTPLLGEPLEGGLYVASQRENPFASRFAGYLVAEGHGLILKLAVRFSLDPDTGRITAAFVDIPQEPFSKLKLDLYGGSHAVLQVPRACGTYTTSYDLTPWSGAADLTGESSLQVAEGCDAGGFSPILDAGTTGAVAGAYSRFVLDIRRNAGESNLAGIELTLPKGLTAKLASVPLCLGGAAATGDCPSDSKVGEAYVATGAGPAPLWVPQAGEEPGAVYLGGPYRGAPFSLVVVVAARSGSFDLGTVVTRATLSVDPRTAQTQITVDQLPQILAGIPIDYRDIRLVLDRSHFILNPTSCRPMRLSGTASAVDGATAPISTRFQVGGCSHLPFRPRLDLSLSGGLGRNGHPALRAVLRSDPDGAAAASMELALPGDELLDLRHIGALCSRGLEPDRCPPASRLGKLSFQTPFLDAPLVGPVYLRAPGNRLPGLVADLRSGPLHFVLDGHTATSGGRLSVRFPSIPDIPLSKAILSLAGGRRGIIVNSRELCARPSTAEASFSAHSGKRRRLRVPVRLGGRC